MARHADQPAPDALLLNGGLFRAPRAAERLAEIVGSWSGKQWIPRAAKEFDGWIASAAKTSYLALADGIRRGPRAITRV